MIHIHCELFQEELKSDPQPFAFQVLQSTQCRIARARSPARSIFMLRAEDTVCGVTIMIALAA